MTTSTLRQALRDRLVVAMRERDRGTVSTMRSAIAALENAEAVPVTGPGEGDGASHQDSHGGSGGSEHVALAATGLGAAEADRLVLTAEQEAKIMRAELGALEAAGAEYERTGHGDRAAEARAVSAELAEVVHRALGTNWGHPRS
jgi:hypothetical protein